MAFKCLVLFEESGVTQKDFKQIIFLLLSNGYRVPRKRQKVAMGRQEGAWGEDRKPKGQAVNWH